MLWCDIFAVELTFHPPPFLLGQVIAYSMNSEQIKELREAFVAIDTAGVGTITLEELRRVMLEHGVRRGMGGKE